MIIEEIIWEYWKISPHNGIETWSAMLDRGEFAIDNKDRGWYVQFWPIGQGMNFIELGYYLSPESAKLAAETYYLHRLRNGTL